MKKILVTACGGPSTMSFTRSIRDCDPDKKKYHIIGTDADKYNIFRATTEVETTYLCPLANDPEYIPFLKHIISIEQIDFLHSQPEIEAYSIGKHRQEILSTGCTLFMPKQETIELLRDKGRSYQVWKEAGITVPDTVEINNIDDLQNAYDKFGNNIWIRETIGAAGKGSLSRPSFEMAKAHIDDRGAWGKTVAAEHLSSDTVTWQSIWNCGKLVVAQGRRRLYWAFSNRAQSGVTGLTGTGITINNPDLDELAIKCITAADPEPHGIFSVDFTFDNNGIPNPTEINIAKFFTTHHFLTRTGCNMPEILIQLAFGEYNGPYEMINPCKDNMLWIRGIDILPTLVHISEVDYKEQEYLNMLKMLKQSS